MFRCQTRLVARSFCRADSVTPTEAPSSRSHRLLSLKRLPSGSSRLAVPPPPISLTARTRHVASVAALAVGRAGPGARPAVLVPDLLPGATGGPPLPPEAGTQHDRPQDGAQALGPEPRRSVSASFSPVQEPVAGAPVAVHAHAHPDPPPAGSAAREGVDPDLPMWKRLPAWFYIVAWIATSSAVILQVRPLAFNAHARLAAGRHS